MTPPHRGATDAIDLPVYSGRFLVDSRADLTDVLVNKARDGVRVRLPSVTVGVRDEHGRSLPIHKIDNDLWALQTLTTYEWGSRRKPSITSRRYATCSASR